MPCRPLLFVLAALLGCTAAREDPAPVHDFASLERVLEADGRGRFHADGEPVTGLAATRYPNGMRLTTSLVDGYEDGEQRLVFEHGGLVRRVPLRAGREHGRSEMWFEDGRPYVLQYFVEGDEVGPQLGWNATGARVREVLRLEGVEHALTSERVEAWVLGAGVDEAEAELWRAVAYARAGRLDDALAAYERSLAAGHPTPSDAIWLLPELVRDAASRQELQSAWREHARESHVLVVAPLEPGRPLLVRLRVVDRASGAALAGVRVRLTQTDAEGRYEREPSSTYNPRVAGSARTDADGRVSFRTIRPAHYAPELDPGGAQPAHVHLGFDVDGHVPLGTELLFADDPRLRVMLDDGLVGEVESGGPVPTVAVEIRLDRAP